MTNNIYPPDHLLRKWESLIIDEEQNVDVVLYEAFQAGADQELEACLQWFSAFYCMETWMQKDLEKFRTARRPRPPSLKEQGLKALDSFKGFTGSLEEVDIIRRALESLPD